MKRLTAEEAAAQLGVSKRSLSDKRYRLRIGLPAVRIGRRIGFEERDVERIITRGRERLPTRAGGGDAERP